MGQERVGYEPRPGSGGGRGEETKVDEEFGGGKGREGISENKRSQYF